MTIGAVGGRDRERVTLKVLPFPEFTLDLERAAVSFGDGAGDVQAEPHAGDLLDARKSPAERVGRSALDLPGRCRGLRRRPRAEPASSWSFGVLTSTRECDSRAEEVFDRVAPEQVVEELFDALNVTAGNRMGSFGQSSSIM